MISEQLIREAIPSALQSVDIPGLGQRYDGKVREMYSLGGKRALITTDRVSAFDRVLGTIPFKGQVLTQLSAWWFEQLSDVVDHHVVDVPDPNVLIGYEAEPLPVEVIVRGYITGSTSTSLWTLYEQGIDRPYGLELPVGLKKNAMLPTPVITPTTKAEKGQHDERLTCAEVVEKGLVDPELWARVQQVSLEIFRRGQEVARNAGLILVDTKYEFGMIDGKLALIDEVHTPDSSRYWLADSYQDAMARGEAPRQFDKEHLRLWLGRQGYKGEGTPPPLSDDIVTEVSARYISAYERLTGLDFIPGEQPPESRIEARLAAYFGVQ
jgi:phosphoribosylaminoimidazole-succinocarboxamide synthase